MRSETPSALDAPVLAALDAQQMPAGIDAQDVLMLLINRCVDALHIMQERMAGFEDHARKTGEVIARNRAESRADISTIRTRLKLAETSVEQMAIRLTACESGTIGVTATHARELLGARTDAETWRKRLEADLSRINSLEKRLGSLETGLERRLEQSEAELADATASVGQLRSQVNDSETTAVELARKLADAGLAIADQRARIGCLQAKLTAAKETLRFTEPTTHDLDSYSAGEGGVIDLAGLPEDRQISAA